MQVDYEKIGNKVLALAENVGEFITEERRSFSKSDIEVKGLHNFVSYVDKEAEKLLVNGLREIFPEAGFITEEDTASQNNESYLWVVDPLDGTTNFIHNVAPHAISIALTYQNETVLGVVYELGAKEMFYSWLGIPVFCNKTKVSISSATNLSDSLVATGFHTSNFEFLPTQLKIVEQIIRGAHGLRRHGSAATDLAYVAAGRFEAFFEFGLSVWDVAAGSFLVKQAGGVVSDFTGGNNFMFGGQIVVGAPQVQNILLNIIKTELK